MTGSTPWKVLLALVALALPVGYVVADVSAGAQEPAPRAAIVLPAESSSGPSGDASPGPSKSPRPDPEPSRTPTPDDDLCDDSADERDDSADERDDGGADDTVDERDDDDIEVIRPCPDDLGDDEGDDDRDDQGDGDDG
jgi:hypothetical protein